MYLGLSFQNRDEFPKRGLHTETKQPCITFQITFFCQLWPISINFGYFNRFLKFRPKWYEKKNLLQKKILKTPTPILSPFSNKNKGMNEEEEKNPLKFPNQILLKINPYSNFYMYTCIYIYINLYFFPKHRLEKFHRNFANRLKIFIWRPN